LLPIASDLYKRIAVIGHNAIHPPIMGGGSSSVTPHPVVSPLDAITDRVGEDVEIKFALGTSLYKNIPLLNPALISVDGQPGMSVDVFDNFDLSGEPIVRHHVDRSSLSWSDAFVSPANPHQFSARLTAKFTAPESGMYTFALSGNGLSKLTLDDKVVVDNWSEIAPGESWADSTKGVSIELAAGQSYDFRVECALKSTHPWRSLQIRCLPPIKDDPFNQALLTASQADLVILFAGTTFEWESEGFDRPDMELPKAQNELIEKVLKVNPKTIMVLNTGAPIRMPWIDKVPALIQAWFGGQEMGNAIADVLFGLANPSGKLPTTFPMRLQDNPAYVNFPGENGRVHYGEGIFVGYRYYEYKDLDPLFPFGYGLSYTKFEYGNVVLSADRMNPGETLTASVNVTNVGTRMGKEIVQLYIRDPQSRLVRPLKELKGFAKVELQPGETQVVSFSIHEDTLKYYDDQVKSWITEPGTFELFIGGSSHDLQVAARLEYVDYENGSYEDYGKFHIGLPIRELLENDDSYRVLQKHLGPIIDDPLIGRLMNFSLLEISPKAQDLLTSDILQNINAELAKIG
jgi:beta-glucosidase